MLVRKHAKAAFSGHEDVELISSHNRRPHLAPPPSHVVVLRDLLQPSEAQCEPVSQVYARPMAAAHARSQVERRVGWAC